MIVVSGCGRGKSLSSHSMADACVFEISLEHWREAKGRGLTTPSMSIATSIAAQLSLTSGLKCWRHAARDPSMC